ncbi:MAG: BON domain-containing protein [Kiritimatiellaeota bacterium]|nr:BON domain-containing protein [Kiritimatiellota bacterium]
MKKMMMGGLMTLVVAAWLAGCDTLQPRTEDQSLSQVVLERLNQDSLVRRQILGVTVENGVVTLRGTITDEGIRIRAKSIAESTPGVVKVQDQTTRR